MTGTFKIHNFVFSTLFAKLECNGKSYVCVISWGGGNDKRKIGIRGIAGVENISTKISRIFNHEINFLKLMGSKSTIKELDECP